MRGSKKNTLAAQGLRLNRLALSALIAALALPAIFACAADGGTRPDSPMDTFGGFASTHIVVRLNADATRRVAEALHHTTEDLLPRFGERFRHAASEWRATKVRRSFGGPFGDPARAAQLGLDRTFIVEVPTGTNTAAMAAAFAALRADVEIATVDAIGGVADVIPDDTAFASQYALDNNGQVILGRAGIEDADIDAPQAWDLHTGNLGTVTLAVIDSGVNPHVEFSGRLLPGHNTADPLHPNLTTDNCPHGTHVAGIAAAAGNNGVGVAGVTWGATILPVRVLLTNSPCNGVVSALADGLVWAADHGADVGNMSLQYYGLTPQEEALLQDAIDYAHDRGMLLVAASGNERPAGTIAYPARLANTMAVGGTTNRDVVATTVTAGWNSNTGEEIDVCAPGDDIYSTWINNSYTFLRGTSMAAAHVSGLAALIKSYAPGLDSALIQAAIQNSCDDLGPAGWDPQSGHGRINAYRALLAASAFLCASPADCDDGNPCTDEACVGGTCRISDNSAACDDVRFCTVHDTCEHGTCRGRARDCADGNPCTDDVCDETTDACLHHPINDVFCVDGLFCTVSDRCVDGACQGIARTCDDQLACTMDSCDEEADACRHVPNDASCGDGDRCTRSVCDPADGALGTGCVALDNGLCGACCHYVSGGCTDAALPVECADAQDQDRFFPGATCDEVRASGDCFEDVGACCDSDPFGSCTQTSRSGCSCSTCGWYKWATCEEVVCPRQAIPALSHWGLVALILLVLIGAKVSFGRREANPTMV